MSIVNSVITRNHPKGNGRLSVHEQHTDHLGEVHEHRYTCKEGWDVNQSLLDWIPILEDSLVLSEKQDIQQRIEDGEDPTLIPIKHISSNQKAKQVVRALMLGSPKKMLKAAQFVQGFTNNQIQNFFTTTQRIRIRERQNYILDNQAIINNDIREEL